MNHSRTAHAEAEDYGDMLNRAPQYRPKPGMFRDWKEALLTFVVWTVIATAGWLIAFAAIRFGLELVGIV